jgi:hypothetical protein
MAGFPTRADRDAFGPTMENETPIENPKREIGAETINLAWWQLGGLGRVSPKIILRATVSGSTATTVYQGFAFDPNSDLANITWTYNGIGYYSFTLSSQYPDENGTNRALALQGGLAVPDNIETYSGTHTGGNNASTLTDGAQSWTIDGLVDQYVYNTTDHSQGIVTANTSDTVTATLSGGTDNDWDTGEGYVVIPCVHTGQVHLDTGYSGSVMFLDHSSILRDPSSFLLALW